jgi:predicted RNA binding protein YcfA (HicA-like mRNA interferase family)
MPSYTYDKLTRKLIKLGFREYRKGKGSHILWVRDADNTVVPIPYHGKKDIRTGTLHQICKTVGLSNVYELEKIK